MANAPATKKGPTTVDDKAKKREQLAGKFRELATDRTSRVLDAMRVLSKLAGNRYPYTEEQAARIVTALREGINDLEQAFKSKAPEKRSFTL